MPNPMGSNWGLKISISMEALNRFTQSSQALRKGTSNLLAAGKNAEKMVTSLGDVIGKQASNLEKQVKSLQDTIKAARQDLKGGFGGGGGLGGGAGGGLGYMFDKTTHARRAAKPGQSASPRNATDSQLRAMLGIPADTWEALRGRKGAPNHLRPYVGNIPAPKKYDDGTAKGRRYYDSNQMMAILLATKVAYPIVKAIEQLKIAISGVGFSEKLQKAFERQAGDAMALVSKRNANVIRAQDRQTGAQAVASRGGKAGPPPSAAIAADKQAQIRAMQKQIDRSGKINFEKLPPIGEVVTPAKLRRMRLRETPDEEPKWKKVFIPQNRGLKKRSGPPEDPYDILASRYRILVGGALLRNQYAITRGPDKGTVDLRAAKKAAEEMTRSTPLPNLLEALARRTRSTPSSMRSGLSKLYSDPKVTEKLIEPYIRMTGKGSVEEFKQSFGGDVEKQMAHLARVIDTYQKTRDKRRKAGKMPPKEMLDNPLKDFGATEAQVTQFSYPPNKRGPGRPSNPSGFFQKWTNMWDLRTTIQTPGTFRKKLDSALNWASAAGIVYGAGRAFTAGVKQMGNFEEAMNGVKKVINPLNADMGKLTENAKRMGQEFGTSINDVAQAMAIFAQQGMKMNDIIKQTRTAVIAANVTDLDMVEATEALTAAQKQFMMGTQNSMRILDSWNEVENTTSVNALTLTKALEKAGTSARVAGVDFDSFNGIVAAVGEATRKSGDEIGTSLKFIFQHVRENKAIDALQQVGIFSEDAAGNMKSAKNVLGELAGKWDNLTDSEKQNVATSIAGTRHLNDFAVMMETWNRSIDISITSLNSQGSAMRENRIVMETLNKQTAQLKSTWESFLADVGKSGALDTLKSIVNTLKLVMQGFGTVNQATGGMAAGLLGNAGLIGGGLGALSYFGGTVLPGAVSGGMSPTDRAMQEVSKRRNIRGGKGTRIRFLGGTPSFAAGGNYPPEYQTLLQEYMSSQDPAMMAGTRFWQGRQKAGVGLIAAGTLGTAMYNEHFRQAGIGEAPTKRDTAVGIGGTLMTGLGMMNLFSKPGVPFMKQGKGRLGVLGVLGAAAGMTAYGQYQDYKAGQNVQGRGFDDEYNRIRSQLDIVSQARADVKGVNRLTEAGQSPEGLTPERLQQIRDSLVAIDPAFDNIAKSGDELLKQLQDVPGRLDEVSKKLEGFSSDLVATMLRAKLESPDVQNASRNVSRLQGEMRGETDFRTRQRKLVELEENRDKLNEVMSGVRAYAQSEGQAGRGVGGADISKIARTLQMSPDELKKVILQNYIQGATGISTNVDLQLRKAGKKAGDLDLVGLANGNIMSTSTGKMVNPKDVGGRFVLKPTDSEVTEAGVQTRTRNLSRLVTEFSRSISQIIDRNEDLIKNIDQINQTAQQGAMVDPGMLSGSNLNISGYRRMGSALSDIDKNGNFSLNIPQGGMPHEIQNSIQQMIGQARIAGDTSKGTNIPSLVHLLGTIDRSQSNGNDSLKAATDKLLATGGTSLDQNQNETGAFRHIRESTNDEAAGTARDLAQQYGRAMKEGNTGLAATLADRTQNTVAAAYKGEMDKARKPTNAALQQAVLQRSGFGAGLIPELGADFARKLASGRVGGIGDYLKQPEVQKDRATLSGYVDQLRKGVDAQEDEIKSLQKGSSEYDEATQRLELLKKALSSLESQTKNFGERVYNSVEGMDKMNMAIDKMVSQSALGSQFGMSGLNEDKYAIRLLTDQMGKLQDELERTNDPQQQAILNHKIDALRGVSISRQTSLQSGQAMRTAAGQGVYSSGLSAGLQNALGMSAGSGVDEFRNAMRESLREAMQGIAYDLAPAMEKQSPEQFTKVTERLRPMLENINQVVRHLGLDQTDDYRKQYLVSSPSQRASADQIRELMRQGGTSEQIFGDPYLRRAAKDDPLIGQLLQQSVDNEMVQRSIEVQQNIAGYTKDTAEAVQKIYESIVNPARNEAGLPSVQPFGGRMASGSMFMSGRGVDPQGRIKRDFTPAYLDKGEIVLNAGQSNDYLRRYNRFDKGSMPTRFDKDMDPRLAKALTKLPNVAEGMTRLFRGEALGFGKKDQIPGWMKDNTLTQGLTDAHGRWFTHDPNIANWYFKDAGPHALMTYLDVPSKHAEAHRVSNLPHDIQRWSSDPANEFFLSRELADSRRPVFDRSIRSFGGAHSDISLYGDDWKNLRRTQMMEDFAMESKGKIEKIMPTIEKMRMMGRKMNRQALRAEGINPNGPRAMNRAARRATVIPQGTFGPGHSDFVAQAEKFYHKSALSKADKLAIWDRATSPSSGPSSLAAFDPSLLRYGSGPQRPGPVGAIPRPTPFGPAELRGMQHKTVMFEDSGQIGYGKLISLTSKGAKVLGKNGRLHYVDAADISDASWTNHATAAAGPYSAVKDKGSLLGMSRRALGEFSRLHTGRTGPEAIDAWRKGTKLVSDKYYLTDTNGRATTWGRRMVKAATDRAIATAHDVGMDPSMMTDVLGRINISIGNGHKMPGAGGISFPMLGGRGSDGNFLMDEPTRIKMYQQRVKPGMSQEFVLDQFTRLLQHEAIHGIDRVSMRNFDGRMGPGKVMEAGLFAQEGAPPELLDLQKKVQAQKLEYAMRDMSESGLIAKRRLMVSRYRKIMRGLWSGKGEFDESAEYFLMEHAAQKATTAAFRGEDLGIFERQARALQGEAFIDIADKANAKAPMSEIYDTLYKHLSKQNVHYAKGGFKGDQAFNIYKALGIEPPSNNTYAVKGGGAQAATRATMAKVAKAAPSFMERAFPTFNRIADLPGKLYGGGKAAYGFGRNLPANLRGLGSSIKSSAQSGYANTRGMFSDKSAELVGRYLNLTTTRIGPGGRAIPGKGPVAGGIGALFDTFAPRAGGMMTTDILKPGLAEAGGSGGMKNLAFMAVLAAAHSDTARGMANRVGPGFGNAYSNYALPVADEAMQLAAIRALAMGEGVSGFGITGSLMARGGLAGSIGTGLRATKMGLGRLMIVPAIMDAETAALGGANKIAYDAGWIDERDYKKGAIGLDSQTLLKEATTGYGYSHISRLAANSVNFLRGSGFTSDAQKVQDVVNTGKDIAKDMGMDFMTRNAGMSREGLIKLVQEQQAFQVGGANRDVKSIMMSSLAMLGDPDAVQQLIKSAGGGNVTGKGPEFSEYIKSLSGQITQTEADSKQYEQLVSRLGKDAPKDAVTTLAESKAKVEAMKSRVAYLQDLQGGLRNTYGVRAGNTGFGVSFGDLDTVLSGLDEKSRSAIIGSGAHRAFDLLAGRLGLPADAGGSWEAAGRAMGLTKPAATVMDLYNAINGTTEQDPNKVLSNFAQNNDAMGLRVIDRNAAMSQFADKGRIQDAAERLAKQAAALTSNAPDRMRSMVGSNQEFDAAREGLRSMDVAGYTSEQAKFEEAAQSLWDKVSYQYGRDSKDSVRDKLKYFEEHINGLLPWHATIDQSREGIMGKAAALRAAFDKLDPNLRATYARMADRNPDSITGFDLAGISSPQTSKVDQLWQRLQNFGSQAQSDMQKFADIDQMKSDASSLAKTNSLTSTIPQMQYKIQNGFKFGRLKGTDKWLFDEYLSHQEEALPGLKQQAVENIHNSASASGFITAYMKSGAKGASSLDYFWKKVGEKTGGRFNDYYAWWQSAGSQIDSLKAAAGNDPSNISIASDLAKAMMDRQKAVSESGFTQSLFEQTDKASRDLEAQIAARATAKAKSQDDNDPFKNLPIGTDVIQAKRHMGGWTSALGEFVVSGAEGFVPAASDLFDILKMLKNMQGGPTTNDAMTEAAKQFVGYGPESQNVNHNHSGQVDVNVSGGDMVQQIIEAVAGMMGQNMGGGQPLVKGSRVQRPYEV